ncbi:MAG: hypothetical protein RL571_1588 [Pseudomonadota bacterium]
MSLEFRRQEATPLKHVRIALVDSLAISVGKELVAAIKRRTGHWSMVTGQSHLHADALLNRRVDLILTDDAVSGDAELFRRHLLREPFILVLPLDFKGPVNSLRTLAAALDFIRYNQSTVIGRSIENQLQTWSIHPPLRMQLDNSYAILQMVKAGLGWTLTTPRCLLHGGIKTGAVQCLPVPEGEFCRELTLLARSDELGNLPELLADDSIALMRERYLPVIATAAPWLLPPCWAEVEVAPAASSFY